MELRLLHLKTVNHHQTTLVPDASVALLELIPEVAAPHPWPEKTSPISNQDFLSLYAYPHNDFHNSPYWSLAKTHCLRHKPILSFSLFTLPQQPIRIFFEWESFQSSDYFWMTIPPLPYIHTHDKMWLSLQVGSCYTMQHYKWQQPRTSQKPPKKKKRETKW